MQTNIDAYHTTISPESPYYVDAFTIATVHFSSA